MQEVTGSRITASFSPWVAVVSVILSFLTVRLAASGPARQMGKLRPIEAVKESWSNPSLEKISKASNPEKVLWIPWKYFCKLHGG